MLHSVVRSCHWAEGKPAIHCRIRAPTLGLAVQDAAGQLRQSPHQFSGVSAMSPLLWLARRYAILVIMFTISYCTNRLA